MSVDNGIINIECIRHGFFKQFIYNHKKGHGCKECALENRKINTKNILREKRRIYHNFRLKNDDVYRCKIYIKNAIRTSLKSGGYPKKSRTQEILGCSYVEFKKHLESQFLPGMNLSFLLIYVFLVHILYNPVLMLYDYMVKYKMNHVYHI